MQEQTGQFTPLTQPNQLNKFSIDNLDIKAQIFQKMDAQPDQLQKESENKDQLNQYIPDYSKNEFNQEEFLAQARIQWGNEEGITALLNRLDGRRNCLKCILVTVQCCQILALIMGVILLVAVGQAKLNRVEEGPECWVLSSEQNHCFSQHELKTLKFISWIIIIGCSLRICIVGGLYSAVTQHNAKRIDRYLFIITIIYLVDLIASFVEETEDPTISEMIIIIIDILLMVFFVFYTHGYAAIIRSLEILDYPVEQCIF